jgi:hypothetical protein
MMNGRTASEDSPEPSPSHGVDHLPRLGSCNVLQADRLGEAAQDLEVPRSVG